MSEDPWRLPTEAAVRAAVRCFRLPALDVAAPLGAFGDPETLLEQLFGRYLSAAPTDQRAWRTWVSTATGDGTTQLLESTSPDLASCARTRHLLSREAAGLPGGWEDSSADGVAGRPLSSQPAGLPGGWVDTSARAAARQESVLETPTSHVPADARHRLTPASEIGNANQGSDLASAACQPSDPRSHHDSGARPAAPLRAGLDHTEVAARADRQAMRTARAEPTPATRSRAAATATPTSEPERAATPDSLPQTETSVTRLGRGAAQLAAVLRAGTEVDPVDRQAGDQPHNGSLPRNAPIDDLVATFTEEVACRLRDELEWEFQRTYGMGG